MSRRRRRSGRVKIAFENLEQFASKLEDAELARSFGMTLTRHSALYRRRNGTYTLCLVWRGDGNGEGSRHTLTTTIRGLVLT